jgi:ABC-type lipoprotein release transport system permease subunit
MIAGRVAETGVTPVITNGVRMALEHGRAPSVVPVRSVPVLAVVVTAVVAMLLAVAIAWWPARAAARTRPAVALRSE